MNKENNDIINKFLLIGDKFMLALHLYQPGKIGNYSVCSPFTKHEQRTKHFLNTRKLNYLYKNQIDKACFKHYHAYNRSKDLKNRTQSDIVLKNRAYKIATNPKVDGFQRASASMVWKFLMKDVKKC